MSEREPPETGELHKRDVLVQEVRMLREDIIANRIQAELLVKRRGRIITGIASAVLIVLLSLGATNYYILDSRRVALEGVVEQMCDANREKRLIMADLIDDLLVSPRPDDAREETVRALEGARERLLSDPCPEDM